MCVMYAYVAHTHHTVENQTMKILCSDFISRNIYDNCLICSPQEDAAEQVVGLVRDNPELTTVIGMHTLGKEDLLVGTPQVYLTSRARTILIDKSEEGGESLTMTDLLHFGLLFI